MNHDHDTLARRSALRVLDASFNRLCEALRAVEDPIRFGDGTDSSAIEWQQLRRRCGSLRALVEEQVGPLALHRGVEVDPLSRSPGGKPHEDRGQWLASNISRAKEAARSVEETLRFVAPQHFAAVEEIRFQIYRLESLCAAQQRRGSRLDGRSLYLLVTEQLCRGDVMETTRAAIEGGVSIVQLREKTMEGGPLLRRARQLRELTRDSDVLLIINDRIDIAHLCDADGVHLGQQDLSPQEARKILGPDAIIGLSTHQPEEAAAAALQGVDYIGVGPIFETNTKQHRQAAGLDYIAAARAVSTLPHYAIGHVDEETVDEVLAAGATRIAVCTGIIDRPDPSAAARNLAAKLSQCQTREVADGTAG